MTFKAPNNVKYPSMEPAYAGGTMTGVLSAANEKAVELFISERYVVCITTFDFCTGSHYMFQIFSLLINQDSLWHLLVVTATLSTNKLTL